MQGLFLLLAVIISSAVTSPIVQTNPDDLFDIDLSGFDDPGIASPGPFQIAGNDAPSQAPAETPLDVPPPVAQPGDPVFQRPPQPKPKLPSQTPAGEQKPITVPFNCGPGKSASCCVGKTRDGITLGCIKCTSRI